MKMQEKKAPVQITLTSESVEKARRLGLDISKVAQDALYEAIRRLQTPVLQQRLREGKSTRESGLFNKSGAAGARGDLNWRQMEM